MRPLRARGRGLRIRILLLCAMGLTSLTAQSESQKELRVLAEGNAPEGAAWRWQLQYWPGSDPCVGTHRAECGTEVFNIRNESADAIECWASIQYKPDRRIPKKDRSDYQQTIGTRIRANDAWSHPVSLPAYGVPVASQSVDCKVYKPEPVLPRPAGCTFAAKGPGLAEFYPPESQQVEETGRVRVRFTLEGANGGASRIRIVDSSLSKRLDDAAVSYIASQQFTTQCSNTEFEMGIRFALQEG